MSMEFNFLGDDLKKTPPFRFPSTVQTHFSDPSLLQGGFPSVFPVPNAEQIMNPNVAGEDILRKLEKERIRREIISGEIARRRMLEEEVRKELMLEREVAFRRSLGEKFLLDEQVAMGLNSRLNVIPPYDNRPLEDRISFPPSRQTMAQVTQLVEPEIRHSPKTNKHKLIMMAKPNPDIHREKRKAVMQDTDDDTEDSPIVVTKKLKDDWSCALCRVSVTSEKALNEHLQGKKHKTRESAQKRMQNIGRSASPSSTSKNTEQSPKPTETIVATTASDLRAKADDEQSPKPTEIIVTTRASDLEAKVDPQAQPEVTKVDTNPTVVGKDLEEVKTEEEEIVGKIQSTEVSEKQNGAETEQVRIIPNAENKEFKFWCELCHVGCCSVVVMENHKRGRKHTNRLKRSLQNDESVPPTSAVVVPEATPLLTKDGDD